MSTMLKWAGNKTGIMSELLDHLPAVGQRLVEPFAGSCSVMMATDYPAYLIADINPDLINLYRQVKDDCDTFVKFAQDFFVSSNDETAYYIARQDFNSSAEMNNLWRAVYFLYLNRFGYRGMCRYNSLGVFNVPYGNYKEPYFPESEIRAFAEKAQRATFICASYEETLAMVKTGDVIYCDPPYDGTFAKYHTAGFAEDEQYLLASLLEGLATQGHTVVASDSDTALTRSLYRDFKIHTITAKRSIGVAAGEGKTAVEIIAVASPEQFAQPVRSGFAYSASSLEQI